MEAPLHPSTHAPQHPGTSAHSWRSVGSFGHGGIYTFENDIGPDDANHAENGLFILANPKAKDGNHPVAARQLMDIAPTILEALGLPIPHFNTLKAAPFWERAGSGRSVIINVPTTYPAREMNGVLISGFVDHLNQPETLAPPRGRRWTYGTVQAILKQPAYTGRAYYNRSRTCHEAVGRAKKQRHFYLLRSLLVCGVCGRTLAGRTADGQVYYYCTNRGKNRSPDVVPHSCSIAGRMVEPLVWEAVSDLLRNPMLLADAWQNQSQTEAAAPDEIHRLQARQRALERQWTRVLDAFQDELIDKAELERRKARLDHERETLEQRLQQLIYQARRGEAKAQMLQDFAAFCQQMEAALADPTSEVKQEVLRLLIDHIVVEKDAIVIKHIIPTEDDC